MSEKNYDHGKTSKKTKERLRDTAWNLGIHSKMYWEDPNDMSASSAGHYSMADKA
jgi:hypothetical protein